MTVRWNHAAAAAALVAALCVPLGARAQTIPGVQTHPPGPNTAAPDTGGAHGRFGHAPIDLGPPNLPLAVAFVADGAGASSLTDTERAALVKRFGAPAVATFEQTARFVAGDAPVRVGDAGYALPPQPSPSPSDGRALSGALYAAGTGPRGRYDAEYMLDGLFSHIVHVQVMDDIDRANGLGPAADATYHRVLAQLVTDLSRQDAAAR